MDPKSTLEAGRKILQQKPETPPPGALRDSVSQWRDAFKRRLDGGDENRLQLPLV
jgi:hypothetical protein